MMPFWPYRTVSYEASPNDRLHALNPNVPSAAELWYAGRQFSDRTHDRGNYERSGHGRQHNSLISTNHNNDRVVRGNLIDVGINFFWNSLATPHDFVARTGAANSTDYCFDTAHSIPTVLMEMIATSSVGRLELLPALPFDLNSGYMEGMLGRSWFTLNRIAWDLEDAEVMFTITSQRNQALDVILRKGITNVELVSGNAVLGNIQNNVLLPVTLTAHQPVTIRMNFVGAEREDLAEGIPVINNQVTLANLFVISDVVIHWGNVFPAEYEVQVSINGTTWETVSSASDFQGGSLQHFLRPRPVARFIRVAADTGTVTKIEVYGSELPDIALNKPASADTTSPEYPAANAFDGTPGTRWGGHGGSGSSTILVGPPNWLQVDLGGVFDIFRVFIRWEDSFAPNYEIQVSMDGNEWVSVFERTGFTGGSDNMFLTAENVQGRYVRMWSPTSTGPAGWGISIWNMEVYGVRVHEDVEVTLDMVLENYGRRVNQATHAEADLNSDGFINIHDLNIVLADME
jgi:hypothetical protein